MSAPKLRFPGFAGEWSQKRLEQVSTNVTSGSRDWAQFYAENGAKFIRMTNLPRNGIQLLLDDLKYVSLPKGSSEGLRTSLQVGDILISITAELGKIGIVPDDLGESYINQHTALVRPAQDKVVPSFLAQDLATKASNKRLNRLNDSGAKSGLNLSTVRGFTLSFPTRPEQQKIAAFLAEVDAKLAALAAKQAALGRFKAGLMQKLFSQQLRFTQDEGQAFPDWQEIELRAVSIINPKSPKLPNRFRYIDLESVNAGTLGAVGEIDATEAPSRAQRVLQRGDILYQMVRPYQRNNLYFDLDGVYVGSTGYAQIRARQNRQYLFHVLHTDEFVNRVLERCTGTGYPAINSNDLGKVTVPFPHPDEQQKIANALSAMDAKIQAVAGQITKLQTFKKGLLQQMFV